ENLGWRCGAIGAEYMLLSDSAGDRHASLPADLAKNLIEAGVVGYDFKVPVSVLYPGRNDCADGGNNIRWRCEGCVSWKDSRTGRWQSRLGAHHSSSQDKENGGTTRLGDRVHGLIKYKTAATEESIYL